MTKDQMLHALHNLAAMGDPVAASYYSLLQNANGKEQREIMKQVEAFVIGMGQYQNYGPKEFKSPVDMTPLWKYK